MSEARANGSCEHKLLFNNGKGYIRKHSFAYCSLGPSFSVEVILNNVRSCIRPLPAPATGWVLAFESLPAATALQQRKEHPSHSPPRCQCLVTQLVAGVWVGNHLGGTRESDSFAPIEFSKER